MTASSRKQDRERCLAASERKDKLHNLGELYLRGSRYSNLCTAGFVAVTAFWAGPILQVWPGPALPMRTRFSAPVCRIQSAMHTHMLTGAGTSIFRGMGRIYEEFTYPIANLALLAVTLPAARWIEGRWTPFGIGAAVCVATAGSACVLMGRALWVLDLRLTTFLRVILCGGCCRTSLRLIGRPVARLVGELNRWQGAGVLVAAGLIYAAGGIAVLQWWVLTDDEKQKGLGMIRHSLGVLRGQEATA